MQFPQELHVVIDGDKGEEYFLASATPDELAAVNESRPAARYALIGKTTIVNETKVK
jgi:hypothetical protein